MPLSTLARLVLPLALAAGGGALAQPAPAPEKPPGVDVELNKLESVGNACRGYFIVANGLSDTVKELRLDVFIFDRAGIILRRAGLTFADVRPERAKVVPFDFADVPCTGIGRLMVNDVLACTSPAGTPIAGCPDKVRAATRAPAGFAY